MISGIGPETSRKKRYTSNREEEEEDTQMCPCGKAIETRTHIVGCECARRNRDVLEVIDEENRRTM